METNPIDHFLFLLGRTSLEAGILVVLVLAVGWLFRKQLTPRWRCALWWMVAVRLLLPVSFNSSTSVFNLLPRTAQSDFAMLGINVAADARPQGAAVQENEPGHIYRPAQSPTPSMVSSRPAFDIKLPVIERRSQWSWPVCIFGIWSAGVLLLAGYIMVSSLRLWRCSSPLKSASAGKAGTVLGECCERLQLRNPPMILESARVGGPALYGLFRPRLLLPVGFTEQFSTAELRFVFLHELAHLKRRDLLMNWLAVLLQVLHWFNPLVWYGFARWRTERELACDAMALEAAGEGQNKNYGRTILRLVGSLGQARVTPGLVGILEDRHQLRRRIGMIASFVPTPGWPRLAVALIGVLAVIGLTDARSNSLSAGNSTAEEQRAVSVNTETLIQQKGSAMSNSSITNQLIRTVATGIVALAPVALPAVAQSEDNTAPLISEAGSDLVGAWVLVGTPEHIGKAPSAGGRIKFFTGSHWCITQAEPKNGVVLFHHGGTYSVNGNSFHANLNFANSSTINMIGKTNGNFTYKVEGDTLTSLGVDNPWKEVWKRLKPKGNIDSPLAKSLTGTWAYIGKPGETNSTPDMSRLKFCVGGYWCDTEMDQKTSVVVIHHGGYYSLKGDKYIETCQYANPVTMNLIGQDVKFNIAIESDTLTLKGIDNPWNEVWKRVD